MKYIIAIDIGGSTFNTGLLSESFDIISVSKKDKIRYYKDRDSLIDAMISQITSIIKTNNITKNDIIGIGIASPGPLDTTQGIILDTLNLKVFQNYNIVNDFKEKTGLHTCIENDANLFSLGEWFSEYKKKKVLVGITLGTGLGFGIIINGEIFKGGNGFGTEYGLSPFKWGIAEKNVCIRYLKQEAKKLYGKEISPRILDEYYYNNDQKAINLYNTFGENIGIVLSHVINMIDPEIITIGGGLSKAFPCFKNTLFSTLRKYAPSYSINNISVSQSILREKSTMIGAAMMVKNIKKNN